MMISQLLNIHRIFKRLAKALIRLRVCAGWSEPKLVAHTTLLEISIILSAKMLKPSEPVSSRRYKLACSRNSDSDQPVHPHSLNRSLERRVSVAKLLTCNILKLWPFFVAEQAGMSLTVSQTLRHVISRRGPN